MARDSLDRLVRLLERWLEEDKREDELEQRINRDSDIEWEKMRDAFLTRYRKRRGGTVHKHRPIRTNNC